MESRKILLLGGSTQQIPAIEYAKSRGYKTILCDFLPDNPGQFVSDIFYCVSTTDKTAILAIAEKEEIDGIVAYASDPAASTAAFVAENLSLPTNPYRSVEILSYKDKFREFLREYGFNCPKVKCISSKEEVKYISSYFEYPVIVKPIDSSGSKGVIKVNDPIDLDTAFNGAMEFSRSKKVIIEEFIEKDHPFMIGGDCFVIDGQIKFWGFLNSHRSTNVSPFVPVGTSFPLVLASDRLSLVKHELSKLISALNIKFGAFNIEVMFNKQGRPFIIELGPRNGGNMIPDLLKMATGNDMVAATVEFAMGGNYSFKEEFEKIRYLSTYVIHASKSGIFEGFSILGNLKINIFDHRFFKSKGESVSYFDGANKAIGVLFLEFENQDQLLEVMINSEKYFEVMVSN